MTRRRGFDLVIFDCDGVLVDSEPIINRAHAEVLSECGYSITEDELVARFCGMSDAEMLGTIEQELGRTLPPFYGERVGARIENGFSQSLVAMPGVAEAIDSLRLPVCVASSSVPEQIRRKLELTGLSARFGENLFSATMVARGKPAPDLFLYAAQRLATAPDHCLVIEDSLAGIAAAIGAGMTAIGFCGGSHCDPEHGVALRARGAVLVLDDMRELPSAIAKLGHQRDLLNLRAPAPLQISDRSAGMISESPTSLEIALRQNPWIAEILERFDEIALPDAWLVAGSLAQTIWNLRCGQPAEQGIKDVDLIYFDDQDLSFDAEVAHERRLRSLFRHLPIKLDVKNEARVHLWYHERFGYRIRPYRSSPDAIATFPTTATAIGARWMHGKFEYCAPFGFDDLFSLVVRPNKKQINRDIYEAKIERWRSIWPRLKIVPWKEMAESASSAACP